MKLAVFAAKFLSESHLGCVLVTDTQEIPNTQNSRKKRFILVLVSVHSRLTPRQDIIETQHSEKERAGQDYIKSQVMSQCPPSASQTPPPNPVTQLALGTSSYEL